ncbi:chaperonin 60 subunit alpha 2, chloroplastic-like [Quercus lobata]|uniref:chaperonin 60 subunit alpha 2, chloroplastic-like n=1 Tax=Quercus lobata TaxID=97700 RepID=UPI00124492D7|nr:chaperonin 60 subunit alpha 2, chloroplastic-like [Quercus lobata]XP_030923494.1 chaperonin 60 subunit alpha 2, chloroplastic-like [Quercus lobata]
MKDFVKLIVVKVSVEDGNHIREGEAETMVAGGTEAVVMPTGIVLLAPAKSIASNAGVDGEILVEKTRTCNWQTGYDAMTGRYEDLLSAGVVDPCQVSRCALQNAVSIAGVVLITQVVLVEKMKKPKPAMPHVPIKTP